MVLTMSKNMWDSELGCEEYVIRQLVLQSLIFEMKQLGALTGLGCREEKKTIRNEEVKDLRIQEVKRDIFAYVHHISGGLKPRNWGG